MISISISFLKKVPLQNWSRGHRDDPPPRVLAHQGLLYSSQPLPGLGDKETEARTEPRSWHENADPRERP